MTQLSRSAFKCCYFLSATSGHSKHSVWEIFQGVGRGHPALRLYTLVPPRHSVIFQGEEGGDAYVARTVA